MSDMKHTLLLCLAAIALTACTQDELAEQGTALPEGVYPITIASVQVAEALPQTRITETSNGMGSTWNERNPDRVIVKVTGGGNDAESTYTLFGNQIIASTANLWWHTTETSSVNAWYSNLKGSNTSSDMFAVTLANQTTDNGLAYVLKADEVKANYQTGNITLTFRHQLAKIRVKLDGAKADEVTSVSVKSRTSCTVAEGNVTAGTDEGYIAMCPATYNGQTYWEANVVPGVEIKDFRLNGNVDCQLTQTVMPQAGHVHEVNINVNDNIPNDATLMTADNCKDINSGKYVVKGAFNNSITITGGNPDIYLDNANMDLSRNNQIINPISITNGANPIIHVVGSNNITAYSYNNLRMAGIYVDDKSSVTICGNGTDDVLTVTGGSDGAAIGGYCSSGTDYACGNITINNVTVYAYASRNNVVKYPPAIGSTGDATCGKITITDAVVHAQGSNEAPAIGAESSVPEITIKKSEIHAYRGSNADYIGRAGGYNYQGGQIQGDITSSTVYKYLYEDLYGTSTPEGVVEFDENGEGKEQ